MAAVPRNEGASRRADRGRLRPRGGRVRHRDVQGGRRSGVATVVVFVLCTELVIQCLPPQVKITGTVRMLWGQPAPARQATTASVGCAVYTSEHPVHTLRKSNSM